ncbi:MAG: LLM class flavin-dependent oxidoreductase [Candidatus Hermodarchaeota archaeon]
MKFGVNIHSSSPFRPITAIEDYLKMAKKYEQDGLDSLWFADHLIRTPDPQKSDLFETWTLIAGLSIPTSKIRFGTLVTPIGFRNIGLFAKMVSTIDHLTNGRVNVGLGAGWYQREYDMFNIPFGTLKERFHLLEGYIKTLLALWKGEEYTHEESPRVSRGYLAPKPIQKPHPPILIGGGGEKRTLKLVAKYAQMSNFSATNEGIKHKLSILENHCAAVGRDFKEIEPTITRALCCGKTPEEVDEIVKWYRNRLKELRGTAPSREDFSKDRFVGTPDQIISQISEVRDLGVKHILFTINDEKSSELCGEIIKEF